MDERLRTQVLSVTVSQCQASMRDVNPTSKQGPEEEPLDNRTLNPVIRQIQHSVSLTLTQVNTQSTDTEQMTGRDTVAAAGLHQPHGRGLELIKVSRTPSFKSGKTSTLQYLGGWMPWE